MTPTAFMHNLKHNRVLHKTNIFLAGTTDNVPHVRDADKAVVEDLEGQARLLIAFCDLPWDPACLSFLQSARTVRTASNVQVRRPLYGAAVGRAAPFRAHLAPLVEALGGAV